MKRRTGAERVVRFARGLNRLTLVGGVAYAVWWALQAVAIVRMRYVSGKEIDTHILIGMGVFCMLALLWLATKEFFSSREQAAQQNVDEPHYREEVFLVAVTMATQQGLSREELEYALHDLMPMPQRVETDHGDAMVEDWWVAEDDRHDRSDCDSAVFVPKGMQAHVRMVLKSQGYSQWSSKY